MALLFPQSADDQVIDVPAGTHTGHVKLTQHNPTFRGAGRGVTRIVADGQFTGLFPAVYPPPLSQGGNPVSEITVEDMTLDGGAIATMTNLLAGNPDAGPLIVNARRVDFENFPRGCTAISLTGCTADIRVLRIHGDGKALQCGLGSHDVTIIGTKIRGGLGGLIVSEGANVENLVVRNFDCRPWYWAVPRGETVTATDFTGYDVGVESQDLVNRSLYDVIRVLTPRGTYTAGDTAELAALSPRLFDRIEVGDGRWTQVIRLSSTGRPTIDVWRAAQSWAPAATPSGTATLYRVTLGRTMGWTTTRISLRINATVPPTPHWRSCWGDTEPTPDIETVARVEVFRRGGSDRDVDVGPIHLTQSTIGAYLRGIVIEGGWSDGITLRGSGHRLEYALSRLGQDMNVTLQLNEVNGEAVDHVLDRVISDYAGFCGCYIHNGNPSLSHVRFRRNGTQRMGPLVGGGHGIFYNGDATADLEGVHFTDNFYGEELRL